MNRRFANTCPDKRRSVVIVMVCVTIPVITGFAALTVDLGRLFCTRAELQITADAAVLAAVQDLRGANAMTAIDAARESAAKYVSINSVWNDQPVIFDPDTDMVFGVAKRAAPPDPTETKSSTTWMIARSS